ncbi:hypothetical protein [Paraburkholderia youngii]|uniref:hypothetical protein n=1 Tax=Paraburkholderia youngii TaxID=2782701 RepID=UPI003D1B3718
MQFNDAWLSLMVGVTAASQSAPHFTNDRLDGMNLSASQRQDVIRRFKALGPGIERENSDSPPLETSVAILLQYLQDRRLKSFGHVYPRLRIHNQLVAQG